MKYFKDNLKNIVDFFLRNHTKFSKKNYFIFEEEIENLFCGEALERETYLKNKYDISLMQEKMTVQNYLENLYVLDILDKYLKPRPDERFDILDVGSKNWFYAKSEYCFFKNFCQRLSLTGVEIDAHRVYNNLFSRFEVAKFHIQDIPQTKYLDENMLNIYDKFDYITWFLPFIHPYAHVKWGLPLKYFNPELLMTHVYERLNPNGEIFIVNQGEDEYQMQIDLLEKLGLTYELKGEITSPFWQFQNKRFALIVKK